MAPPERWEGLRVGVASGNPRSTCASSETLPSPARALDFAQISQGNESRAKWPRPRGSNPHSAREELRTLDPVSTPWH